MYQQLVFRLIALWRMLLLLLLTQWRRLLWFIAQLRLRLELWARARTGIDRKSGLPS